MERIDEIEIDQVLALGYFEINKVIEIKRNMEIYNSGEIPEDLVISTFVTMGKKPSENEYDLNRLVILLSNISKLNIIIFRRT